MKPTSTTKKASQKYGQILPTPHGSIFHPCGTCRAPHNTEKHFVLRVLDHVGQFPYVYHIQLMASPVSLSPIGHPRLGKSIGMIVTPDDLTSNQCKFFCANALSVDTGEDSNASYVTSTGMFLVWSSFSNSLHTSRQAFHMFLSSPHGAFHAFLQMA